MISDTNKAFCDLARCTYGKGWDLILSSCKIVNGLGRARVLAGKHDIEPSAAGKTKTT